LEHHAKQRDIVTHVAELDKLLQRAEWARVMAERQHSLHSGQKSVKVNYNVMDKYIVAAPYEIGLGDKLFIPYLRKM